MNDVEGGTVPRASMDAVAEVIGLAYSTVKRWAASGKVKSTMQGNRRMILLDAAWWAAVEEARRLKGLPPLRPATAFERRRLRSANLADDSASGGNR